VNFALAGELILASNIKGDSVYIGEAQTLNTNGHTLDIGSGGISIDGTLNAGSSEIQCGGNWTLDSGGTFTASTSTVVLDGSNQTISGNTTFYALKKSVTETDMLSFDHNSTQTITGSLELQGAADNLLNLRSTQDDDAFGITYSGEDSNLSLSYLNVKDADASGGKTLTALSSVDADNNSNWSFDLIESVTDVQAEVSGNSILITWMASADAASYDVYRDTEPNFTPDQTGGSNRIATGVNDKDPDTAGVQWTDSSDGIVGDVTTNYFYAVTAVDAAENESDPSNKAGEFDFELHTTPDTNYTWITIPLALDNITNAEQLADFIGDKCISVGKFDAGAQSYITHIHGLPLFNFAIDAGQPYRIQVSEGTIITLTGQMMQEPQFTLVVTPDTNYTWITLPFSKANITTVEELADDIGMVGMKQARESAVDSTSTPLKRKTSELLGGCFW